MCAHLLPYSLAVTMPSTSCAASCRLLLGLYCNLRINSPPDALLHLELRIYAVVTEFALLVAAPDGARSRVQLPVQNAAQPSGGCGGAAGRTRGRLVPREPVAQ